MAVRPVNLVVVLLLAGLFAVLLPPTPGVAAEPDEIHVLDWANDRRDVAGLPRLRPMGDLDRVATTHSQDMARASRLHHNPDLGDDVTDWALVAENVGAGSSLAEVLQALWDSPGHRQTLLDPRMTDLGVGIVRSDGRVWLTQVFRRPPTSPFTVAGQQATRIQGHDATSTSVAVSREHFSSATVVHLARADQLADAVAGGSLTGGPVLLVPRCGDLPPIVADEIARLDPSRVLALGGRTAVCDRLLRAAGAGRRTGRLAGDDRYATSATISREQFEHADVAYVARGDRFTDAVAGGALVDGPVLLVPSCGPSPASVERELDRLGVDRVVALGGPTAVCDSTLRAVAGGRATGRLAGPNRYATAVTIVRHATGGRTDRVHLARADRLADAVAGGTLASGPVLLVPSCGTLPPSVADAIAEFGVDDVRGLGGPGAVCHEVLGQAVLAAR